MDWMEIGLFQLENLTLMPTRFLYLDLRVDDQDLPPNLLTILKSAQRLNPELLDSHLTQMKADQNTPMVLVCETGDCSRQMAQRLVKNGYQQVYVVSGGVRGLLAELG